MWTNDFSGLGALLDEIKNLTIAIHLNAAKEMAERLENAAKATYHQTQLKMEVRNPAEEQRQAQIAIAELQAKMKAP